MIYVFKHPKKEQYREIVQRINEKHEYIDSQGVAWERVFTAPQVTVDSNFDPFSEAGFAEKTGKKKGTMGDLLDRSRELSDKRAQLNGGVDPVKEKTFEDYSKKRRGLKHPNDPKRYDKLNKMGVKIDLKG